MDWMSRAKKSARTSDNLSDLQEYGMTDVEGMGQNNLGLIKEKGCSEMQEYYVTVMVTLGASHTFLMDLRNKYVSLLELLQEGGPSVVLKVVNPGKNQLKDC